jgi:hypothetical protein
MLIFSGGGLLVATLVEVSLGLQVVDIAHLRWQPLVVAALGNAAIILRVSASIESLFWIWRANFPSMSKYATGERMRTAHSQSLRGWHILPTCTSSASVTAIAIWRSAGHYAGSLQSTLRRPSIACW